MFYNNGQKPTYETIRKLSKMENQLACVIPHDKWDGETGIPELLGKYRKEKCHQDPKHAYQGFHGGLKCIDVKSPNFRPYDRIRRGTHGYQFPEGMYRCSVCKRLLPISEFHKNSKTKRGHSYRCRECCSAILKSLTK